MLEMCRFAGFGAAKATLEEKKQEAEISEHTDSIWWVADSWKETLTVGPER